MIRTGLTTRCIKAPPETPPVPHGICRLGFDDGAALAMAIPLLDHALSWLPCNPRAMLKGCQSLRVSRQ